MAVLSSAPASLSVERLALSVLLGETAEERALPQRVEFSFRLFFAETPEVAKDDQSPFICYDKVCQAVLAFVEGREFRFIEYLAHELHAELRRNVQSFASEFAESESFHAWVKVHKCHPPVEFEVGAVSYEYSDLPTQ